MTTPALARVLPAMALACLASACIGAPARAESPSLRNVLIIHSGAEDFPANPIMDAAIREALASRPDRPIAYFAEYLETEQFGGIYDDVPQLDAWLDTMEREVGNVRAALHYYVDRQSHDAALRLAHQAARLYSFRGSKAEALRLLRDVLAEMN